MIWLVMQGWYHEGEDVHSAWSTREEALMVAEKLLATQNEKPYPSIDFVRVLEMDVGNTFKWEEPYKVEIFDRHVPRKTGGGGITKV